MIDDHQNQNDLFILFLVEQVDSLLYILLYYYY